MSKNKSKQPIQEDNPLNDTTAKGQEDITTDNNSEKTASEAENMTAAGVGENEASGSADATEQLMLQVKEWQEKYIRLSADFDNFRKRTMREKMDLIKTAGEDVLVSILPVVDDFERAIKAMETATEVEPVKDGVILIYNKFNDTLSQKGIKAIEAQDKEFDTDLHEAITKIPVAEEGMKGKVVDVIQKGYMLQDKVVRYAKVVVGE